MFEHSITTLEILEKLARSDYKFYLTGGKYFGVETPESDWDFFVQEDPNIYNELEDMGFIRDAVQDYTDIPLQEVVAVYRYPTDIYAQKDWFALTTQEKKAASLVDVQVSKNAEKRQRIQQLLALFCAPNKPNSFQWEWAFELAALK